ncbi:hypothetical protein Tco_1108864 [Tanacetum coccineum]
MDDEPMWAVDHVVAPTPDSAITIPETTNESPLRKTVAFTDEDSSNSDTDKIMAQIDAITMQMDAQYTEMQSRSNHSIPEYDEDDKPMSPKAEAKFMQTFRHTFMDLKTKLETTTKNHQALIHNLEAKFNRLADKQSGRPYGSLYSNTQPNPKGSSSKPYQPPQAQNEHANVVFTRSVGKFTFLVDFVILEMEEDGSEILHSIEGNILEEKLFAEFNEFMAMNIKENSDFESDTIRKYHLEHRL